MDSFFMSKPDCWSSLTAVSASMWDLKIATTELFLVIMFVLSILFLVVNTDDILVFCGAIAMG